MRSRQALIQTPATKPGYRGPLIALLIATAAVDGRPAPDRIGPAPAASGKSPASPSATIPAAADSAPGKAAGLSSTQDLHSLIDQEGRPFPSRGLRIRRSCEFHLHHLRGELSRADHALVGIQGALPPALRPRVRFVSVTVDPDQDSALALKRYATSMGADLSAWSFVTGKASELDWLQRYYSVGATLRKDGQYDHEVGIYLLDARGRLMQRYPGNFDKRRLLREIAEVDALNK